MLSILGVGLSRTGTKSLAMALTDLGFNTLHWAPDRLSDVIMGETNDPSFARYDDVDAVVDIPAAYFYREIAAAYPGIRAILTTRPVDLWSRSIGAHYDGLPKWLSGRSLEEAVELQKAVYGSDKTNRFLYRKRYLEHNESVQRFFAPNRLLVFDVFAGDGWLKLCQFLDKPVPSKPFPQVK